MKSILKTFLQTSGFWSSFIFSFLVMALYVKNFEMPAYEAQCGRVVEETNNGKYLLVRFENDNVFVIDKENISDFCIGDSVSLYQSEGESAYSYTELQSKILENRLFLICMSILGVLFIGVLLGMFFCKDGLTGFLVLASFGCIAALFAGALFF